MSRAYKALPATEQLWELFDYKPLTGELVCREISNCRAHLRVHRLVPYRGTESLPTSWECVVGVGHAGDRFFSDGRWFTLETSGPATPSAAIEYSAAETSRLGLKRLRR